MANGNSKKDLSASIIGGSEEIFDFSCQPCSTDNLNVEAVGYCQDCCEYLCDNCCNAHRKLSATKHHTMLGKSNMSESKLRSNITDVLTEKCPKHNGNVLEYFCKYHNQICCSVCITLNHSSCSNKSYIPDISGDIANSQEYIRLIADLDKVVTLVTVQQKRNDEDNMQNKKMHSKALADIKHFRQEINKFLDKLEEGTIRKVSSVNKANAEKISSATDKNRNLLSEVNSLKTDLTRKETGGKTNQLYVTTKLSQDLVTAMNSRIDQFNSDKIILYKFHHDEKIQQMMCALSAMWSLSVRQDDTPTTAQYVREVNMKLKDDKEVCHISGIVVLTGARVVVTDFNNSNVKLIDTKTNKPSSCLSVSSKPFDVIETKPNQIAVALGSVKKLEIITVTDVLTRSHTIDTPGADVAGLCYDGLNYITACQHPPSVKIITMSGTTLNTFTTDSNDKDLFTMPRFIALGRGKDVIYVTDWEANTVTCLTTGGHVITVYRHDMLKYPCGVAVDKYGSVYVCSRDTHTVHQLSPTGDLTRILLRQDQGLVRSPNTISYSDEDDKLYISSLSIKPGKHSIISLYQLEQRL